MKYKVIKICMLLGIICSAQILFGYKTNGTVDANVIRHKGNVQNYGQPYGPTWMHIYVNGKKTKTTLNPEKIAVAKLAENDVISFGNKLPLLGEVKTSSFLVNNNSEQATLDQSESFKKRINIAGFVNYDYKLYFEIYNLKNIKAKAISKMAFSDLTGYLDAISNNDESKLPNNSSFLKESLKSINYQGKPQNSYKLETFYFNKRTALNTINEFDANHDTYLTVGDDTMHNLSNATELTVDIYAKVKKTVLEKDLAAKANSSSSDTTTEIEEYQMTYQLLNNKWQLIAVTSVGDSPYAMNTSSKAWIVKKVQ